MVICLREPEEVGWCFETANWHMFWRFRLIMLFSLIGNDWFVMWGRRRKTEVSSGQPFDTFMASSWEHVLKAQTHNKLRGVYLTLGACPHAGRHHRVIERPEPIGICPPCTSSRCSIHQKATRWSKPPVGSESQHIWSATLATTQSIHLPQHCRLPLHSPRSHAHR